MEVLGRKSGRATCECYDQPWLPLVALNGSKFRNKNEGPAPTLFKTCWVVIPRPQKYEYVVCVAVPCGPLTPPQPFAVAATLSPGLVTTAHVSASTGVSHAR